MKKKILFSFILPAYKIKYLEKSIKSILSQTYDNFEIIIIDDDSPYQIKDLADSFADNRLFYYRNEHNIGGENLVKQWNHCIKYAKGDYIILAADDDLYSPDFLSESLELINKYPDINVIRGRVQNIDDKDRIIKNEIQLSEFISFDEFLFAEKYTLRCIGNYVFKTQVLLQKGFVDYPLAWWSDLATVIQLINNNLCITQKTVYSFRISNEQISANQSKNILYKKIIATHMFFSSLKTILQNYNTNYDFIKNEIYKKFIKDNDMFFKETLKLIQQASFKDFIPLINHIHKDKIISTREKYKLFFYYIIHKGFK